MPGSIPEHKIQEVREVTDIVDLISDYVTLKKRGQNLFGLCPFHNEKTPSFSVNPDKQIFRCFGCGAGGNVFTFLMRHEGTSFPDTVKFLAQRAGIELDFEERDRDKLKLNETLFHINEFAAGWFQESLLGPAGGTALDYLKSRGLSLEYIRTFGLGYALPGWDNLIKQAERTANDVGSLLKAGLVLEKEDGRNYDRFRDRIMFPIRNLSGKVVAFGGRLLRDVENTPKYINSPETAVYEKGKLLYGLYQNRDEIRKLKKAIFVEGYMDLLSLVSNGIKNVVATSGTALTEDQARLINRYTKNVVLMYDSDVAGSAATLRGADVLIEAGLEVEIVSLPERQDPDSFVRQFGASALLKLIENATNLFEYKLQILAMKPPEKRGEGVRSLLESLARVKDNIRRSLIITKVSESLGISENVLWGELQSIARKKAYDSDRRGSIAQRLNDLGKVSKASKFEKAVEDLVRILIHEWRLAGFVFSHLDLTELKDSKVLAILTYLKNQYKGGKQPSEAELIHQFNDVETSEFIIREINRELAATDLERWASDCIKTIKTEGIRREIDEIREQIKLAQNDSQRVSELLQKCMELESQKKSLKMNFKETSKF